MEERITGHKLQWTRVQGGPGNVESAPLDPKILEQMPPAGSKTFLEIGPVELLVHKVKKLLEKVK